jgi:hypothetical protein
MAHEIAMLCGDKLVDRVSDRNETVRLFAPSMPTSAVNMIKTWQCPRCRLNMILPGENEHRTAISHRPAPLR